MKRITALLLTALLLLSLAACGGKGTWQEQYDLGMRYLNEGNYQEAVIAFEAAIKIDPKRPEAYLGAAEAYVGLGDADSARKILEKGLSATGENTLIQDKLAELENGISGDPDITIDITMQNNHVLTYSNIPEVFSKNFDDLDGLLNLQGDRDWIHTWEQNGSINGIDYSIEVQTCSYEKTNGSTSYYGTAQGTAPVGSREFLVVDISLWDAPNAEELGVVETGWLDICMGDSYATVLRKLGFEDGMERYKYIQVDIYADGQVNGYASESSRHGYSCVHTTEMIPCISVSFHTADSTAGKNVVYEFHEGNALNRVRYENDDLLMKLVAE